MGPSDTSSPQPMSSECRQILTSRNPSVRAGKAGGDEMLHHLIAATDRLAPHAVAAGATGTRRNRKYAQNATEPSPKQSRSTTIVNIGVRVVSAR